MHNPKFILTYPKLSHLLSRFGIFDWYYLIAFLSIAARGMYIFNANPYAGDTELYLNIARNIASGNGFSYTYNNFPFETVPVIGGYMPGYPAMLAILLSVGLAPQGIAFIVDTIRVASSLFVSHSLYKAGASKKASLLVALTLCFSPWGLGFSRFILIEPLLGCLSLLLLGQLIRAFSTTGIQRPHAVLLATNIALGVALKPIYIVFALPCVCCMAIRLGLKMRLAQFALILFAAICLSVIPWGLRNYSLGSSSMLPAHANIFPKNVEGFGKWVNTFAMTQYEYVDLIYPSWSGRVWGRSPEKLRSINVRPNIFLSTKEAAEANSFLQRVSQKGFTAEIDGYFSQQALARSSGLYGLSRFAILKTIQSASIFIHPMSSWGLPIELGDLRSGTSNSPMQYQQLVKVARLLLAKLMAFIWRAIILYSALIFAIRKIFGNSCFCVRKMPSIAKALPLEISISIWTFAALSGLVFIIIFLMGFIEQHYFYPVVGWLETLSALYWHEQIGDFQRRRGSNI
jgi:hypothetical protein